MHDDPTATEALTHVVVAVAFETHLDTGRHERSETLAGRTAEVNLDGSIRQTCAAPLLGDRVAQHRADRAVHVANLHLKRRRSCVVDGILRPRHQLLIEGDVEAVILHDRLMHRLPVRVLRNSKDRTDIEPRCLPVINRCTGVEHLNVADHFGHRCEAKAGHQFANLFSDVLHEVDDELGLTAEPSTKLWVLRGNANWACVEVAHTHHHATADHQGGRCETELLSTEQCSNNHVATGLELTIGLHHNAIT